jgi:hypothetical protein
VQEKLTSCGDYKTLRAYEVRTSAVIICVREEMSRHQPIAVFGACPCSSLALLILPWRISHSTGNNDRPFRPTLSMLVYGNALERLAGWKLPRMTRGLSVSPFLILNGCS